jgi:ATP-binding cassette subfamily B protein
MFTSVITFVFKDLFLLVGIAAVLLSIDWKLALVSFTVIPFVLWAAFVFAHHARDAFRTLKIKLAEINTRFSETIGGVKVIQAFGQEKRNYRRFKTLNHENYEAGMRQIHVFAIFMPVIELLGSIAIAIVIFYGGGGVLGGGITLGALVAFISYMKMFFRPIRDIAEKYNIMQNAMASAERIFLILDSRDRISSPPTDKAVAPPSRIDSLAFEGVSFEYLSGESVLKEISFSVRAGESVAVVGPTGAGKTSLINLITRFYDPRDGRVLINGQDIRHMELSALRSRIALVTQDPFLFSGTVRANIQPVEAPLSDADMASVLGAANCEALVDRLPKGLDTELSEGGASISSGERQLLSIARAFARDPDLILLDEATSYIDSETEYHIQEALWNLMRDRTAILVAHRLSTARQADRILVIHRGRIIESGSHDALMAAGGFYCRLHQLNGG